MYIHNLLTPLPSVLQYLPRSSLLALDFLSSANLALTAQYMEPSQEVSIQRTLILYKLVNKRSETDLCNTQSSPRCGDRATVC